MKEPDNKQDWKPTDYDSLSLSRVLTRNILMNPGIALKNHAVDIEKALDAFQAKGEAIGERRALTNLQNFYLDEIEDCCARKLGDWLEVQLSRLKAKVKGGSE